MKSWYHVDLWVLLFGYQKLGLLLFTDGNLRLLFWMLWMIHYLFFSFNNDNKLVNWTDISYKAWNMKKEANVFIHTRLMVRHYCIFISTDSSKGMSLSFTWQQLWANLCTIMLVRLKTTWLKFFECMKEEPLRHIWVVVQPPVISQH